MDNENLTIEQINENKTKEQYRVLTIWKDNGFFGTAQLCTGFGKTRVGVIAADALTQRAIKRIEPTFKVLILTPTEVIRDVTWPEEFYTCNKQYLLKENVTIACMQTAYKWEDTEWDLVISDEIHNFLSPEYKKFYENNIIHKHLGLSAHIPVELREELDELAPIIYTITLREAKKKGFVSDYVIYAVPLQLTEEEQEIEQRLTEYIKKEYPLHKHKAFAELPNSLKKAIAGRISVLNEAEDKIKATKEVSDLFPDRKGAIFSLGIPFIERLRETIGNNAVTIHSEKTALQNKNALKAFKTLEEINRVISIKKIREGVNVPEISLVIVVSRDSKPKSFIQQVGRGVRFAEDKICVVVMFYIPKTKDEDWIKSSTKGNDVKVIKLEALKQLYGNC